MYLYRIQPQPMENKGILPRPAVHIGADDEPSGQQKAAWIRQVDEYFKRKTREEGVAWRALTMREVAVWYDYVIGRNKCYTQRVEYACYEMEALQREIGLPSIRWIVAWYKVRLVVDEVGLEYLEQVVEQYKKNGAEG